MAVVAGEGEEEIIGMIREEIVIVWRRFWYWLYDNCPILCDCGHWCRSRDVQLMETTWGEIKRICLQCQQNISATGRRQ